MSISTSWSANVNVMLYIDNKLHTNELSFFINETINCDDRKQQLVNYSRKKVFLTTILEDTIVVDNRNPSSWKLIEDLEQNVMYLPTDPTDFNVLYAVYKKLVAISEDKYIIDYVGMSSRMGDDISYQATPDLLVPEFKTAPWCTDKKIKPWWNRNDITTRDDFLTSGEFIVEELTWEDLDLGYNIEPVSKKESKFKIITGGKGE